QAAQTLALLRGADSMGDRSEARLGRRIVLCLAALNLVACATLGDPPPTLYKRLGGREGIALVVGDFVTNMAGDRRVNARFKDMKGPDVEKLKSNLADQICDATGGPCSYVRRDMKTAHNAMQLTDAPWSPTLQDRAKTPHQNH